MVLLDFVSCSLPKAKISTVTCHALPEVVKNKSQLAGTTSVPDWLLFWIRVKLMGELFGFVAFRVFEIRGLGEHNAVSLRSSRSLINVIDVAVLLV